MGNYCTVCPRSSDPFYRVPYNIKWVTTSWTYSKNTYGSALLAICAPSRIFINFMSIQQIVNHYREGGRVLIFGREGPDIRDPAGYPGSGRISKFRIRGMFWNSLVRCPQEGEKVYKERKYRKKGAIGKIVTYFSSDF